MSDELIIHLNAKEAFALASIVDYHQKRSNMTLHCTEVMAERACKKIYEQIGDNKVTISDKDIK